MTFDPTRFTYVQCEPGDGSAGASLTLNTNQIGNGKLGVVLALPLGSSFPVGVRELIRVRLIASPSASGLQFVTLTDDVVTRCVSDTLASDSGTAWQDGQVTVASLNPQPTLTITRSNDSVRLSWPVTAVDFALQVSTNIANTAWTNAPAQPQTNGSEISVLLPATNQLNYFRLLR
jgi:hypothetical protein